MPVNDARARASATPYPRLFSPFQLGSVRLPNRVVVAPMSSGMGHTDGRVSDRQIAFYRARAAGGVGMVVVEFCCVDPASGRSEPHQLSLETAAHVDAHRRLVKVIQAEGAVACLQLQHGGMGARRDLIAGTAVGPCDVYSRKYPAQLVTRGLHNDEIEHLVECFGLAAERGVKAGYEAFELHGAHGYLLTCFMSPLTNQRSDAWGGDESRRLAFPLRVIERVKAAIGNRPLIYRLSAEEYAPEGLAIDDTCRIAPLLVAAGADALHVSTGLGWTGLDRVIEPMSVPEGWRLPYARKLREATGVPVIAVGQIRRPKTAERALQDGDTDLVALGRPLLADPQWAIKARAGSEDAIRPCTSCNYCITAGEHRRNGITCAVNPIVGREGEAMPDAGSQRGQRAFVVGAGPAGMAAALWLDHAGYQTVLVEARSALGGGLVASAAPPSKWMLERWTRYFERRLAYSAVEVRLGVTALAAEIAAAKPAIVIVATGTDPKPLDSEDLKGARDAYELLCGGKDLARLEPCDDAPVAVYGGGETGCETAEVLTAQGLRVLLVSRSAPDALARSAEAAYRKDLLRRMGDNDQLTVQCNTHIRGWADGTLLTRDHNAEEHSLVASELVLAQGRIPNGRLAVELSALGMDCAVIGDARRTGRIGDAVHDAYDAVLRLCEARVPTAASAF